MMRNQGSISKFSSADRWDFHVNVFHSLLQLEKKGGLSGSWKSWYLLKARVHISQLS